MSNKPGRTTKLTPEVQERIIQALTAGNYQEVAAQYAGINPSTYYKWLHEAREENASEELKEFLEAVEKARAQAEVRSVALIQNAANGGTWQAAAWWLERSKPTKWGRQAKITQEISGPEGGPIEIDDPRAYLLKLIEDVTDESESV